MGDVLLVCLWLGVGILVGFQWGWTEMQTEAIQHGYALHDAKTGEWRWK